MSDRSGTMEHKVITVLRTMIIKEFPQNRSSFNARDEISYASFCSPLLPDRVSIQRPVSFHLSLSMNDLDENNRCILTDVLFDSLFEFA